MKTKLLLTLLFITSVSTSHISAQNVKSISIENIDKEVVWPAVFKAFKELKLPRPLIATQQGTGETSYYNYKSLMIKNRLRFKINYQENKLTISIFERQYYTNTGWADNPLPISKKRVRKILNPIKERIVELTKDKLITGINQKPQTNQKIVKNKAGIYEDFVIVKTGNPEMDLLAIHKNGNIIGYDLWEDKKIVKALVFQENKESVAVTTLFNEKGFPNRMITEQFIVNISSIGGNMVELAMIDLQGNTIGNKKIELPVSEQTYFDTPGGDNIPDPLYSNIFTLSDDDLLSFSLKSSSTFVKAISCGAAVAGGAVAGAGTAGLAGALVFVRVVAACESIYFDLVARYVGEDHFMFKELNLASDISSILSAINPTDPKKWIKILSISNDAIASLINSYEGGIRLFNKNVTISKTQTTETKQESENTDSPEKTEIEEEYIRISALDPALGIVTVKPKPATIEKFFIKNVVEVFEREIEEKLWDKNITTLERDLFDKILGELNLGSSELADPNMSLKLGRLTLAGFYIINKYTGNKEKTTINLRVVYTETGEIVYANTLYYNNKDKFDEEVEAEKEAPKINAALEKFANKKV